MNVGNDSLDRHRKNMNEDIGVIFRQKNTLNHSKGTIK